MSKIALTPSATGTGVFTISSPATNTNRTLTLPDEAGTVLTSASSIPTSALTGNIIQNAGPAFFAYRVGSAQTISAGTFTTTALNTVGFNEGGNFDTSTYRFTPTIAGYYQFHCTCQYATSGINFASIWKNSTRTLEMDSSSGSLKVQTSGIIYLNGSSDYVSLQAYSTVSNSVQVGTINTILYGALVRAA